MVLYLNQYDSFCPLSCGSKATDNHAKVVGIFNMSNRSIPCLIHFCQLQFEMSKPECPRFLYVIYIRAVE
ncbi:hypothetical protein ACTXT7_006633 [Hymenolepis weldensis]